MILSRKHKFIFVHIYKNAGTSIKNALRPFVTTKMQRESVRALKRLRLPYPQHWDLAPFHEHVQATELVAALGQSVFDSFFSFAIVRNPWDWQVSLYTSGLKYANQFQPDIVKDFRSFDEYIRWRCDQQVHYQKDFVLSDNDQQIVDFIGRYENLDQEFEYICSRIGVFARLPKLNVSKTHDYREYYCDKTIDLVNQAFEPDICAFGYDFETSGTSNRYTRGCDIKLTKRNEPES